VLIAVGNSDDPKLLPLVEARLSDPQPLIRGAAIWAFRRLAADERVAELRAVHLKDEHDPDVAEEWDGELVPPLEGARA